MNLLELNDVDSITVGTVGEPGQRTFYLQAVEGEMIVTLIIEKEQAAALSIVIQRLLEQLGEPEDPATLVGEDLIHPLRPLFRVEQLSLGYDHARDQLVIVAREAAEEGAMWVNEVRIWGGRRQMAALALMAARAVVAGRPLCPFCQEPINPGEVHACVKGNGRKRLYEVDGS